MRGYLQRLAAGVLHAQRAIHPSVGALWSGETKASPMTEPLQATEVWGETLTPTPHREAVASTPELPAQPRVERERSAERVGNTTRTDAEQPDFVERVAFHPLVAFPRSADAQPAPASDEAQTQGETFLSAHEPAGIVERSGLLPRRETEAARSLVPAQHLPAIATGRRTPFAARSSRFPQQAAPAAEERDSIEIHIGRIEVLAAAPRPAQPVAPRPQRKSLDLGEYLRRERRPQ